MKNKIAPSIVLHKWRVLFKHTALAFLFLFVLDYDNRFETREDKPLFKNV